MAVSIQPFDIFVWLKAHGRATNSSKALSYNRRLELLSDPSPKPSRATMPENLFFLRRFPAVPAGLNSLIYSYPALACWAIFASSPSAATSGQALPGLGLPAP